MAWSWSHPEEAYEYAENKLRRMKKGDLNIIWAEWHWHFRDEELERLEKEAFDKDEEFDNPNDGQNVYEQKLKEASKMPADVLADKIWDWASEAATCDNGGWNAWVCPDGCHTVPFGPKER